MLFCELPLNRDFTIPGGRSALLEKVIEAKWFDLMIGLVHINASCPRRHKRGARHSKRDSLREIKRMKVIFEDGFHIFRENVYAATSPFGITSPSQSTQMDARFSMAIDIASLASAKSLTTVSFPIASLNYLAMSLSVARKSCLNVHRSFA